MYQYALDEQTAIVGDGVRLLSGWTGRPVLSHRAGAYGADDRTLEALARNGVIVDSSVFWRHPNSRLDGLGFPRNLPARRGSIVQIPVTVYQRDSRPSMFGARVAPVTVVGKIDVDWMADANEMRSAIDAVVAADLPVLVVFLHSFSFAVAPAKGGPPVADRQSIDLFRATLDYVAAKQLSVVTMRDLASERPDALTAGQSDVVPRVAVSVDVHRYLWRRLKASRPLAMSVGLGVTLAVAGAVLILIRRGEGRFR